MTNEKSENQAQGTLLATALAMDSMVEYQTGAIVSRTLLDKTAGTVTLFAFDQGQGLSEHTAPYDAMVYVVSGQAEIQIEGMKHTVHHNEFIIMPANKTHAVHANEPFKMLLIMIRK